MVDLPSVLSCIPIICAFDGSFTSVFLKTCVTRIDSCFLPNSFDSSLGKRTTSGVCVWISGHFCSPKLLNIFVYILYLLLSLIILPLLWQKKYCYQQNSILTGIL